MAHAQKKIFTERSRLPDEKKAVQKYRAVI
jgi:hypothetical protein